MKRRVSKSLRAFIRKRAGLRCEYCLLHERWSWSPHEPDHIVPCKHDGKTDRQNLALACAFCNGRKGTDLAAIDPRTGRTVLLFHPRKDRWATHFRLRGAVIAPLTAKGRATAHLLQFNHASNVEFRRMLIGRGLYP